MKRFAHCGVKKQLGSKYVAIQEKKKDDHWDESKNKGKRKKKTKRREGKEREWVKKVRRPFRPFET